MANLKSYVRHFSDIEPFTAPLHEGSKSWLYAGPALENCGDDISLSITEIYPEGAALKAVHADADHVFYYLSGHGYQIVDGERFDFEPGDCIFIPKGCYHEMYPSNKDTLKMIVTFTPALGTNKEYNTRNAKPFKRNLRDVEPGVAPKHEKSNSWAMVTPKTGGTDSIEFYITEIRPGGAALLDMHPNEDHVFYYIAGHGYQILDGERFDFGPGDAIYVPRGVNHEMYPSGDDTLRMAVTFSPSRPHLRPEN